MTISNPRDARAHGIEAIYQKLALADNIDAAGNVFLGREIRTKFGSLDDSAMSSATQKLMKRLNPRFKNLRTPVKSLSGGQRQSVAIARAVHFNAKILIMDEPTAALGPAETGQVRDLITELKAEGIGIFLISHDIHDVFDLADRISVMLQGKLVGTVNKDEVTKDEVLGDDHHRQDARRGVERGDRRDHPLTTCPPTRAQRVAAFTSGVRSTPRDGGVRCRSWCRRHGRAGRSCRRGT